MIKTKSKTKKQPELQNSIKFIILNFGYVESAHGYSWIFEHRVGFQTKFEAALSLAKDYYESYIELYPLNKLRECCKLAKKEEDAYCRKCGSCVIYTYNSFCETYKDWLYENSQLNFNDNEGVNYFDTYSNWSSLNPPYGITKENSLYISAPGKVLIALLYKTGLENYIDEDIECEILGNTTFEKFKDSFNKEDGPNVYG